MSQFLCISDIFPNVYEISVSGKNATYIRRIHVVLDRCDGNPHEGSDMCVIHCQEHFHGHCINYGCDSIPEEGNDWCVRHCFMKGHEHCTNYDCEYQIHEGSDLCERHCSISGHSHCKHYNCSNQIYEGSDLWCKMHYNIQKSVNKVDTIFYVFNWFKKIFF